MYSITYNKARNEWMVWKQKNNDYTVVKRFKTEQAAKRWIEKQG